MWPGTMVHAGVTPAEKLQRHPFPGHELDIQAQAQREFLNPIIKVQLTFLQPLVTIALAIFFPNMGSKHFK